jgi:hypothetical protein
MPSPLTAAEAWTQAAICAEQAGRALNADRRDMFIRLRDSWIQVANELQLVEGLKRARRVRRQRVAGPARR